jgi:hypothetical protein
MPLDNLRFSRQPYVPPLDPPNPYLPFDLYQQPYDPRAMLALQPPQPMPVNQTQGMELSLDYTLSPLERAIRQFSIGR